MKKILRIAWVVWLISFLIFALVLIPLTISKGMHSIVPSWYSSWGIFNLIAPVILAIIHVICYITPIWEGIKDFINDGL